MQWTKALTLGVLLAAGAVSARAQDLEVTVRGVANDTGVVRVDVCPKDTFLTPHCPYNASAPAHAGDVDVKVADVPPGHYAVQAFHDADNDGKFAQNFLGIPREGIGFSNDARITTSAPKFEAADVDLTGAEPRTAFALRYFSKP
jgi:uncharacterized protein (DUF2141 family)